MKTTNISPKHYYTGKVRNIYNISSNVLLMEHSQRFSSFDRNICDIPNKGELLTLMSQWWFKNTTHIISNHYLHSIGNMMFVKKCIPFHIEFVVRGYITGSTSTSLWINYKNGIRNYCGIQFPDGLIKNQKLEKNVVTPTTKGDIDELITSEGIVSEGYMTQEEWNYCSKKSLELFEYGQLIAKDRGLILVDTKYEFGRCQNGNIILIDELHTCDSSRYWIKDTYQKRFEQGLEPEKIDKDMIRDFISKKCDPYKTKILPDIPNNLINDVQSAYIRYYEMLSKKRFISKGLNIDMINEIEYYFQNIHKDIVVTIAGSHSDYEFVKAHTKTLDEKLAEL